MLKFGVNALLAGSLLLTPAIAFAGSKAPPQDQAKLRTAFRDNPVHNFAVKIHGAGDRHLRIAELASGSPNLTVRPRCSIDHSPHPAVEWRTTMDGPDGWRLSNVTVAGLSMAAAMRAQFYAISDQDGTGLTPLISRLHEQSRG